MGTAPCVVKYSIRPLDEAHSQSESSVLVLLLSELPLVEVLTASHERKVPRRLAVSEATALVVSPAEFVHESTLLSGEIHAVIFVLVTRL